MPRRNTNGNRFGLVRFSAAAFMTIIFFTGCGGSSNTKPTAAVSGTVKYEGNPVSGGVLIFSPIGDSKNNQPGKAGEAVINPDGSFTVTTYKDGDGAVIGKHRVNYMAPPTEQPAAPEGGHAAAPPPSKYAGLSPKVTEVTVSNSRDGNKLEVELILVPKDSTTSSPASAHGN